MWLRRKKTPEERDAAARREDEEDWERILRRYRKYGRDGFIVVRSAEGAPISRHHLNLLQPAE